MNEIKAKNDTNLKHETKFIPIMTVQIEETTIFKKQLEFVELFRWLCNQSLFRI